MKKFALLFGVFVVLTSSVGAKQPLAVEAPEVMLAPGHLVVRTLVEPDPANRAIQVTAESADFYRRSQIELSGNAGPRRSTFEYSALPRGTYEIHAVLLDADGTERATVVRTVKVLAKAN